jgi:hypothetical protein
MLDTTNSRCIENLIVYFKDQIKGMKAVEYRIWARSFFKHRGNPEALKQVQAQLNTLRNRHKR